MSNMAGTPLYILPYFALQHDFAHVFADLRDHTIQSEDIFLSCYKSGVPSVHGKVNTSLDVSAPSDILLEAREGVDLKRVNSHSFLAGCPAFGVENATLRVPRQSFNVNSESRGAVRPITAFDVSPDASLIASGHLDGSVSIQSTSLSGSNPLPLTSKTMHLSTILSLRFFPSSRVLLSSSSDLSINILSADPSPSSPLPMLSIARTLKGHTAAITDTHIIGAGKQVYSCGKDGTVRLWDVAQASKAGPTMASERSVGIMRIAVVHGSTVPDDEDTPTGAANDSLIFVALQNGTFNAFDARVGRVVYALPLSARESPASLLSIAHSDSSILATGSSSGVVSVYDTRQLPPSAASSSLPTGEQRTPALFSFKRSNASIDDLQFFASTSTSSSSDSLLIATGDGFPYRVTLSHPGSASNESTKAAVQVLEEYSAHDDQAVSVIRTSRARGASEEGATDLNVWTAGSDGVIRKY